MHRRYVKSSLQWSNYSFLFGQVKIREGQAEDIAWCLDVGATLVCQSDPTWYQSDPKSTSSRRLVTNEVI